MLRYEECSSLQAGCAEGPLDKGKISDVVFKASKTMLMEDLIVILFGVESIPKGG